MIDTDSHRQSNIAMVVFSYYPSDPRVRREAEALANNGMCVDIICLRDKHELKNEVVNGVRVYRLPLQRIRAGKLSYIWEYAFFILMSFIALTVLYIFKHYRIVHVHNMPDILVFCALIPKLFGAGLILDLHDPMPEVYMSKYSINNKHPVIKLLRLCQHISIRFADLVLTVNEACRELFILNGCPEKKIQVIMNSPQESIFLTSSQRDQNNDRSKKFMVMYHGTIFERNGLGVAIKAIGRISHKIPNLIFDVYGDGDFTGQFLHMVKNLKLEDVVRYHGHVSAEKIAASMKNIDVGLIPCVKSIHWEYATPTRIFEYLCMGKPVIAPRTKGILDYFDDTSIFYYDPGSEESMSRMILEASSDNKNRQSILAKGIQVYQKHKWSLQRDHLITYYNSLIFYNRHNTFHERIKKIFNGRI